jgi:hypothetical protein
LGLAAGFDITDKLGMRLGWTYTNTNMQFKDYSGTGSDFLDSDDLGKLKSNIAALDVVHYFVGSRSLSRRTPVPALPACGRHSVPRAAAHHPRRLAAVPHGHQCERRRADSDHPSDVRAHRVEHHGDAEPIHGNRSYKSTVGDTFDEPSRINKTEWRFAAAYYFGEPDKQPAVTAAKTH